jgi:hypothetical protein
MKNGQKLKLGDAHATPKKYPRSTSIKADASQRGGADEWRRRPLRRVTGPWTPSSLDMVMVWISLLPFLVAAKGEAKSRGSHQYMELEIAS